MGKNGKGGSANRKMNMKQRVLTGNLVLSDKVVYGSVTVEEERISRITEIEPQREDAEIIVPGFLDIHFHGTGPYGVLSFEDIAGVAAFEPQNGVTVFTPAMGACPRDMRVDFLRSCRRLAAERKSGCAVCAGSHLEGPWLDYEHRGGMGKDMLAVPDEESLDEVLKEAAGTLKLVTLAPDVPNGLAAVKKLSAAGVVVSIGHSGATPEEFTAAVEAGLSHVCHLFDAYDPRPVEEGVTRYCLSDACLMDDRVTVELICDGFHVPPELVKLACRLAGIDRIVAITDSMQGTGLPNGTYRQEDGTYYYLDNDSVCRSLEEDVGIVGSCLPMKRAFTNLVNRWGFSLVDAVKMTSANPARVIGVDKETAALREGFFADINILAPGTCELRECIVRGESCFCS